MRIGIVVDGDAESQALRELCHRIEETPHDLLSPLYADMQPTARPHQIALAAQARLRMLDRQGAEYFVLLLDREDVPRCPPGFARAIEDRFDFDNISAVIKNRCFENWLIADPGAFRSQTARYDVTQGFVNRVSPNSADSVRNPVREINRIAQGNTFHKRRDARELCRRLEIAAAAQNSRSFRRFLRVIGHRSYQDQSRDPV